MAEVCVVSCSHCVTPVRACTVQAVRTLLDHYLTNGQYNVEPEGRSMPKVDMSSYQRA
jgi:hypothetical protein